MRILVVEDDRLLNNTLCYNLSAADYEVDAALTKSIAERFCRKQEYDLIVLDINLPDGNGFDFCRDIKESHPDTAVIFLTANDMESDMLKGYELGADDYVTKPFPMSVFQKKVSALLARIRKQSGGDFYNDGNLFINFTEMTATLNGESVSFTPMEYRLLKVLTKKSAGPFDPAGAIGQAVAQNNTGILWMNMRRLPQSAGYETKLKTQITPISKPSTAWAICGLGAVTNEDGKTLGQ